MLACSQERERTKEEISINNFCLVLVEVRNLQKPREKIINHLYKRKKKKKRMGYLPVTSKKASSEKLTKEQLKTIFLQHDVHGEGRLSRKELSNAFRFLGDRFPNWRARRCLSHVDTNADGCIDLDEIDELVRYAAKFNYKKSSY